VRKRNIRRGIPDWGRKSRGDLPDSKRKRKKKGAFLSLRERTKKREGGGEEKREGRKRKRNSGDRRSRRGEKSVFPLGGERGDLKKKKKKKNLVVGP